MRNIFSFALLFTALCAGMPAQQIVLRNGQYFNGETFVAFEEMVIDSGRIARISDKKQTTTADTVIDAHGLYIIPGLIDAHVHLQGNPGKGTEAVMHSFNAQSALRAGVTTQLDLFSSKYKDIAKMSVSFPQYFCEVLNAGPCLTVPGGHGANMGSPAQLKNVKDAREWAKKLATDPDIDFIKIIYQRHSSKNAMTQEEMMAVVEVAHHYGKKVLAHIDHSADAIECAQAGVDALAHIPMNKMTDAEVDTLKQTGILIIPTYTVYEASYDGLDADYASDSLLKASAHPVHLRGLYGSAIPPDSKKEYWGFEIDYSHNLKKLAEKGIPVIAGTDAGNYATFYGYALHHELEMYVKHGLTPAQALATATANINLLLPGEKTGRITEGYQADLVLLTANPLENIQNTKAIQTVISNGVVSRVWAFK